MKKSTFKRFLSLLMVLSMVMSMMAMPAAAEETVPEPSESSGHTCSYTVESIVTNATCGAAGEKKLSCSVEGCENFITEPIDATGNHTYDDGTVTLEATCGAEGKKLFTCTVCNGTSEEAIDATGNHTYNEGVCTVCNTPKPCSLAADCDANTHVEECLSQCDSTVNCDNKAHKEGCLSQVPCTCVSLCTETKACPVCEGEGECKGGEAAERIAAVQTLIDALPTHFTAEQRQAVADQYAACTDAIAALTDAERGELDLTRYYAADQATEDPSNVNSLQGLKDALAAKAKVINIIADITVTGKSDADILLINSGVTINGNGKTITSSAPRIVNVETTDAVSINNLTLKGDTTVSEQRGINIINVACNLSLNAVNVSGISHYAVHVATSAVGAGSISIQNCSLTGYSALSVYPENYKTTIANSTLTGTNPFPYDPYNAYAAIVVSSNNTVSVTGGSITASTTNGNHQAIVTTDGSGSTFDISNSTTLSLQGEQSHYVHDGAYGGNTIKMPSANATVLAQDNLKLVDGKIVPIINHEDALKAAVAAGGTVKLEGDITLTETLVVPAGKTVTLDLNGKTLNAGEDGSSAKHIYVFENKGTLTITGTGFINTRGIYNDGTLILESGTINIIDANGGFIMNRSGTFTMNGGKIITTAEDTDAPGSGNYDSTPINVAGGTVILNDGQIEDNQNYTYAVTVQGGTLQIPETSTVTIKGQHGAIGVNSGSVTIQGGTATCTGSSNLYTDHALYLLNGTLSVSGGNFIGSGQSSKGDSSFCKDSKGSGTVTINGGTFNTDISSHLTAQYTQKESGKVEKATPTASAPKVETSINQSSATQEQKNTIGTVSGNTVANTANATVTETINSKIDSEDLDAAVEKLLNEDAVQGHTNTNLEVTLKMDIKEIAQVENAQTITSITYDISPVIQIVKGTGEAKQVLASEPITELNNEITITIPVPFDVAFVNLKHTHKDGEITITTDKGDIAVQGTHPNKYITYTTKEFSEIKLTPKTGTAPVAKVGDAQYTNIADAIAILNTNGGTLQLLANIETNTDVAIPTGKTGIIDLNGKTYTYTGTNAAFVNNGTSLSISGGTVIANNGTLVQNTTGALTVTNVTYSSSNTSGHSISATGGTATITSGTFSGNAYSICGSGSAVISINGGTFHKGVAASAASENITNITINNGTFNAETNAFNNDVNGDSAANGTIYIPGNSTARFKANPPAALIQANYHAVLENGMYKIQKKASVTVGTTEHFYGANDNLDKVFTANSGASSFTLSRNEELKNIHTFTAATTTIDFNGKLIYGGGSVIADAGKSIYLNNIGSKEIDVVLGPGDKAVFGTDGTVTITAAENKNTSGQAVGYGEVLLTVQTTSGTPSPIMYYLGKDATLKVDPTTGSLTTSGQVITGSSTSTKPTYYITQVDNGSTITSSFVYGSSKTLTFSSNAFFEGFVKVTVNNKELLSTAYTAKAGSTIVTLSNSYLKTLNKGTHTLTMHFMDGQTASANFYVVSEAKPAWNPQTGDMIMTSVIVMAAAAAGLAALWFIGKKKKK